MQDYTSMPAKPPVRIAIFGATSGIATAVARALSADGARFILLGRNMDALSALADDLRVRGAAEVSQIALDQEDGSYLREVASNAFDQYGGLDLALIALGTLPDQGRAQRDPDHAARALRVNLQAPMMLCEALAGRFAVQGGGVIAAITSVAGDRGRAGNYIYGAGKGGLQRYLEGLRHRLYPAGVAVLDIWPGFVRTAMTAHLNGDGLLWAAPDRVARDILTAVGRRQAVLYTPWFWRWIMLVIRCLPMSLFHRTRL
jgi:short-subunit dehydrogenase